MFFSTKGRYGLKAMVDLAIEYGNGPVSALSLAQRQDISTSYLEQMISQLKKAGLIIGSRGAYGGYELSRAPEDIYVGTVLRVLEGDTDLVSCVGTENAACNNACSCSARPLWLKLQGRINEVLFSTTLADMAEDYKSQLERCGKGDEYHIPMLRRPAPIKMKLMPLASQRFGFSSSFTSNGARAAKRRMICAVSSVEALSTSSASSCSGAIV